MENGEVITRGGIINHDLEWGAVKYRLYPSVLVREDTHQGLWVLWVDTQNPAGATD
jgi:hypothetical protein